MTRRLFLFCLVAFLTVSCGARQTPTEESGSSSTTAPSTVVPTPAGSATPMVPGQGTSPLPAPGSSPISPLPPRSMLDPVSFAIIYLANELRISPIDIMVVSSEEVEWPDTSLGCPQPDVAYVQVVTSGYRVVLSVAGEEYEVHTDAEGEFTVLCP